MSDRPNDTDVQSSDTREDALAPGEILLRGQYRIQRYLSSGGFGITYLALDSLDRKTVIKECFPDAICCRKNKTVQVRSRSMAPDFETVVRHFQHEARRLAKLSHPNIVGVHQVFEDNNTAYMALDFIEGRDLMSVIDGESAKLPPKEIKIMLVKLLEATAYIHEHKVLHRDISPDNILVDKTGNPVLIDFGAAREVASNASRALSALNVVKDGYSPQEFYLADQPQTAPSDLYSLAATFYHLITGKAPPNSQVRLSAIASKGPDPYTPIRPYDSGFDHFFLQAIDKALAVFPEDRPQTAVDWIEMIEEERRQKAMKARAHRDKNVDMAIKLLTEETNRAIAMEISRGEPPAPRRGDRPARPGAMQAKNAQSPKPNAQTRNKLESAGESAELVETAEDTRHRRSLLGRLISMPGSIFRKSGKHAPSSRDA